MSAVDFGAWAQPDLPLTLGGVTYAVKPPSVADMRQVLALAVRAEVGRDQVPEEIVAVLDALPTDGHPALGDTYRELVDAGVDPETLSRMGVYATLFWARGRQYADFVAEAIWGPERDRVEAEAGGGAPKRIEEWTAADWAEYGIGEPIDHDEQGVPIFADYRQVPREAQELSEVGAA